MKTISSILVALSFAASICSCGSDGRSDSTRYSSEADSTSMLPPAPPPPIPDGALCFVTHDEWDNNDAPQMAILNSDGSGYRVLNSVNNAQLDWITNVSWKPDASAIAFIARRGGVESVFLADVNGTSCIRLTQDESTKYDLCWSPTGEFLAYTRVEHVDLFESNKEIWVTSADGSEQWQASQSDGEASEPRWSEDGQTIYYMVGSDETVAVHLDGSQLTLSSDSAYSEYQKIEGVSAYFDYSQLYERYHSGGEISLSTPRWTHSQTYLSSPPYFNGSAYEIPGIHGEVMMECHIGSSAFYCRVNIENYDVVIPEDPVQESTINTNYDRFYWVSDTELLTYGNRQNLDGFYTLDMNSGQLTWIINNNDARLLNLGSWDYVGFE